MAKPVGVIIYWHSALMSANFVRVTQFGSKSKRERVFATGKLLIASGWLVFVRLMAFGGVHFRNHQLDTHSNGLERATQTG